MSQYEYFLGTLRDHYAAYGRHDLPWRQPEPDGAFDPYKIMVSEIMLQQTQVPRVIPKYYEFLQQFPSFEVLAAASLGDVLVSWQGLGYNRRAKFLWQAAQAIMQDYEGRLPHDQRELEKLPGIGHNTVGAILAYAYNEPTVFIETNIRTVYIHHFFKDQQGIADTAILPLVEATLDSENPRQFYWSLMDYGTYIKQTAGNLTRASKSYLKQSKFEGSLRQVRGRVLRELASGQRSKDELLRLLDDDRAGAVLDNLEREGLIVQMGNHYRLP